ncbi:gamma-glutamyl-gamma-aminobutyrate hydrolase family protein [Herminiimonas glaciei]|uniref:Gamma-glutamyl-gamma-aminobutyrate hydrolase family protein n=1 Tax=Herminiimonas glaciei TaxID=523788 RepID=A0ABW2I7F9_9BURK
MRIAISQRVDLYPDRNERRDALDQAWGDALENWFGANVTMHPIANRPANAAATLDSINPDLLILSGGNDIGTAPERDATERALLEHAATAKIPVLGICRGLQMFQHFLGGSLIRVDGHVACAHAVHAIADDVGLPVELLVNSYHTSAIGQGSLAAPLKGLYQHADGTIEAAQHTVLPWLGIMWHPERTALGGPEATDWLRGRLQKVMK